MRYIEALEDYVPQKGETSLFLGGGITNCYDWQEEVVKSLSELDLVILNPRRKNFPIDDPTASEQQIRWEFDHLQKANMMMFWFSPETLCPITLFEYGKLIVGEKTLFVGGHPDYQRLRDVQIQTSLQRPNQKVHTNLQDLISEIKLVTRRNP